MKCRHNPPPSRHHRRSAPLKGSVTTGLESDGQEKKKGGPPHCHAQDDTMTERFIVSIKHEAVRKLSINSSHYYSIG